MQIFKALVRKSSTSALFQNSPRNRENDKVDLSEENIKTLKQQQEG